MLLIPRSESQSSANGGLYYYQKNDFIPVSWCSHDFTTHQCALNIMDVQAKLSYTSDFFLLMASLEAHLRLHLPHSIACKSIQHSSPAPFGDGSCCFIHIMTSHPKKVLTCLERSVLIVRKKCLPRFTRDTFQVLRVWPNCTSTPLLSSSNWGVRLLNLRLCFWIMHDLSRDFFGQKNKSSELFGFQMSVTFRNKDFLDNLWNL